VKCKEINFGDKSIRFIIKKANNSYNLSKIFLNSNLRNFSYSHAITKWAISLTIKWTFSIKIFLNSNKIKINLK
jgi:hypothetical protein